jgi:hypothetical protein
MCGDSEDSKEARDVLMRLAQRVDVRSRESALPGGMPLESEAVFAYMDRLFTDITENASADAVAVAPESRVDLVRSQAVVLARAAGLLAGCIGGDGALHVVMDALLTGYASAGEGAG